MFFSLKNNMCKICILHVRQIDNHLKFSSRSVEFMIYNNFFCSAFCAARSHFSVSCIALRSNAHTYSLARAANERKKRTQLGCDMFYCRYSIDFPHCCGRVRCSSIGISAMSNGTISCVHRFRFGFCSVFWKSLGVSRCARAPAHPFDDAWDINNFGIRLLAAPKNSISCFNKNLHHQRYVALKQ